MSSCRCARRSPRYAAAVFPPSPNLSPAQPPAWQQPRDPPSELGINMTSERYEVEPVAHVVGGRIQPTDDYWGGTHSIIRIDPDRFTPEATRGLADFSHLEVVFHFHLTDPNDVHLGARRPGTTPTGRAWASSATATCAGSTGLASRAVACSKSTTSICTSKNSTQSTALRSSTSNPGSANSVHAARRGRRTGRRRCSATITPILSRSQLSSWRAMGSVPPIRDDSTRV